MAHPLDQQNDTQEIHINVVCQEFIANSRTLFNLDKFKHGSIVLTQKIAKDPNINHCTEH